MQVRAALPAALSMLLFVVPAWAHHGKDFLLVESYELPHTGQLYFVTSDMLLDTEEGTTWEAAPSLLFGVRDRVAAEVHAHLEREPDDSLKYEAIAPSIHLQLSDPHRKSVWRFGLSAEYEIARAGRPDDNFESRLIASRRAGGHALVLNLVAAFPRQGTGTAGYAIGWRPDVGARYGWGLEAEGEAKNHGTHEAIFGLYGEMNPWLTLKVGVGGSWADGDASTVVHGGVVIRLH